MTKLINKINGNAACESDDLDECHYQNSGSQIICHEELNDRLDATESCKESDDNTNIVDMQFKLRDVP